MNWKFIILAFFCCTLCCKVEAVPAYPWPMTVMQPDGTALTLQVHGDEWFNWTTTADGYTLLKDAAGYWCYAQELDGHLVATDRVARDRRTEADLQWLATVEKNRLPTTIVKQGRMRRSARQITGFNRLHGQENFDMDNFRGLVILVNYNDRKFLSTDPHQTFDDIINQEHFEGYTDEQTGDFVHFTGSVHDYFRDNTRGRFAPHFDVVGPVDIDYSQYSGQNNVNMVRAALAAADSLVNFADYDANADGLVDMFYLIVAGYGANYGNNGGLLWPYASNFQYFDNPPTFDGMQFGRFACSTELQGLEGTTVLEGIGTICHEFSHVLGLPDLYDVDYSDHGQSNHPMSGLSWPAAAI